MNLQCCENPQRVRVWNVGHTSYRYEYVPCGKCNTCRVKRMDKWIHKIEDEAKCWPFCTFVTLTYDDAHVPTFDFDGSTGLLNFKTGEFISLSEYGDYFDLKSRKYLHRRHNIYALNFEDMTLFLKRLRFAISQLHSNIKTNKFDEKIRFFYTGEYGETYLRPHFHLLLFYSSPVTAQKIGQLVHKAWQNGNTDTSPARDKAAHYVAGYVNSIHCLPKVLTHPSFKPKCVCSKCPSIGSLLPSTEEVLEVFHSGACEHSRVVDGKVCYFPVAGVYQSAIFPKCQGFSDLNHSQRVALYGIAKFSGCSEYWQFNEWIKSLAANWSLNSENKPNLNLEILYWLAHDDSLHPSALKNLWNVSQRVLTQARIFNVTLDYYVSRIELFWQNKNAASLRMQLEFEQDFASVYGSDKLLCMFSDFVRELDLEFAGLPKQYSYVDGCDIEFRRKALNSLLFRLESLGIDPHRYVTDVSYRATLNLKHSISHLRMTQLSEKRALLARKTKRKNEYRAAHPEKEKFVF